jgi:hypothetical protein
LKSGYAPGHVRHQRARRSAAAAPLTALILLDGDGGELGGLVLAGLIVLGLVVAPVVVGLVWRAFDRRR